MLGFMRGPLLGVCMLCLAVLNTLFWISPLLLCTVLKVLIPQRHFRLWMSHGITAVAEVWCYCNDWMLKHLLPPVEWDISGTENLQRDRSYLVTSNHQSWLDILVMFRVFLYRIPFFKFFLKRDLIWIPILGMCWWALDYPFMRRYTRKEIEKNPSLAGQDIATTREACRKFEGMGVSVMNFMEGTRIREHKHAGQNSPYPWLLKPRAGGISVVLGAMGEQFHCLLNVTMIYPDGIQEIWDYLCGRVRRIKVVVQQMPIPAELCGGDYNNDPKYRAAVQAWTTQLWQEKNDLLQAELGSDHDRYALLK